LLQGALVAGRDLGTIALVAAVAVLEAFVLQAVFL